MTINSISGPTSANQALQSNPPVKPQPPQQKPDTVQLSDAAKASTGDVDNDGDSH